MAHNNGVYGYVWLPTKRRLLKTLEQICTVLAHFNIALSWTKGRSRPVRPWPDHFLLPRNFKKYFLPFKVIASPPSPYDSTSALHVRTTFQQPTIRPWQSVNFNFTISKTRPDKTRPAMSWTRIWCAVFGVRPTACWLQCWVQRWVIAVRLKWKIQVEYASSLLTYAIAYVMIWAPWPWSCTFHRLAQIWLIIEYSYTYSRPTRGKIIGLVEMRAFGSQGYQGISYRYVRCHCMMQSTVDET